MYSMVLFIVDTSFSGFFGSGESPISAVERIRATNSSGARPVNSTWSVEPELVAELHEVVVAVAASDQGESDVCAPETCGRSRQLHVSLRRRHPAVP